MSKRIIAIDPGVNGGFAWFDSDGHQRCCPMPATLGDAIQLLMSLKTEMPDAQVYLERLVPFIPGAGAGSMFKLGNNYGELKGAIQALGFRMILVMPKTWQKHFNLGSKKDSKISWKNKLKAEAQRRFPNCDVTLKTADALLILEYASKQA